MSTVPVPVILVAIVLVVILLISQVRKRILSTPYRPNAQLLSAAELKFFRVLEQACGSDMRVFVKVRLADLLTLEPRLTGKARLIALNRVAAKHVDFVLCRSTDLAPIGVVELNDRSHDHPSRSWRDRFVAEVCRVINLPLLTIAVRRSYDIEAVQAQIRTAISEQR